MGDISTRGKGKALKMKKGGALPSNKGASKAGMQSKQGRNFLLPKEPPKRRNPDRPKFTPKPKPMPRPMPRDPKKVPEFRPMPRPMPRPRPLPRDLRDLEKYMMQEPRKLTPAMKKDGGEMMSLKSALSKAASGAMGVSAEKLKQAFEQAKKMKPTGRINMDDLKKALKMVGKEMMGKADGFKGKPLFKETEPKLKGRLGGPKTQPKIKRTLRKLI